MLRTALIPAATAVFEPTVVLKRPMRTINSRSDRLVTGPSFSDPDKVEQLGWIAISIVEPQLSTDAHGWRRGPVWWCSRRRRTTKVTRHCLGLPAPRQRPQRLSPTPAHCDLAVEGWGVYQGGGCSSEEQPRPPDRSPSNTSSDTSHGDPFMRHPSVRSNCERPADTSPMAHHTAGQRSDRCAPQRPRRHVRLQP
jgi:hypothetical protein